MRLADIGRMCIDNLKRRKGRTILTVLGVFIGCTSIVVMVSIGIGMKESQDQMLESMGDLSIIEVSQGYNDMGNSSDTAQMDDTAVESFRAMEGVEAVMPKVSLSLEYPIRMTAGINDRYYCDWVEIVGIRKPWKPWATSCWTARYRERLQTKCLQVSIWRITFMTAFCRKAEIMWTGGSAMTSREMSCSRMIRFSIQ